MTSMVTNVRVGADLLTRMGEAKADIPAKLIVATVSKLREAATRVGLDFKRPENVRDPRARTCRVTDGYRMVLCDAGTSTSGEHVIIAIDVLEHDDAYRWCERNVFVTNPVTGAVDIVDIERVQAVGGALTPEIQPERPLLFAAFRDRELVQVGVPRDLIPALRAFTDEAQVLALGSVLPPAVRDAVIGLAAGLSVEEVWRDVQNHHAAPGLAPEFVPLPQSEVEAHISDVLVGVVDSDLDVAPESLADAALSPASSGYLHTFTDDADLLAALEAPLARWRVFLHPRQEAAARRRRYSGPARVTGGPGTGKSIVAIHRVAHLLGRTADDDRILLTTYTTSLRSALQVNLVELVGSDAAGRVDVRTVDSVPSVVASHVGLTLPAIVYPSVSSRNWQDAAAHVGDPSSADFLEAEFGEVVEPQRIETLDAYLTADRRGRGSALAAVTRTRLWPAFEHFRQTLGRHNLATWAGRADRVADALAGREPPYRHVVVDEAQDLGPAHWRLLRAVVGPGPDDLFIAGDGHQRIYARGTSLSRLGIETRGRSTKLTINYRSTEQILRWASGIMTGQSVADLDEGNADLSAYRSMLQGERPRAVDCNSLAAENEALVAGVRTWLSDGIAPHEIAIAGRTKSEVTRAVTALAAAGVPARALERDDAETDGHVIVSTMHRLKGLEYRCVHVIGVSAKKMPLASQLNASTGADRRIEDVLLHERALLYVACTRAREALTLSWHGERSPFVPG